MANLHVQEDIVASEVLADDVVHRPCWPLLHLYKRTRTSCKQRQRVPYGLCFEPRAMQIGACSPQHLGFEVVVSVLAWQSFLCAGTGRAAPESLLCCIESNYREVRQ